MSNPAKMTLIACNVALCDILSTDVVQVCNTFFAKGIIPTDLYHEVVNEPHKGAERIVSHLIDRVEIDNSFFQKVLDVLESLDCSEDAVDLLRENFIVHGGKCETSKATSKNEQDTQHYSSSWSSISESNKKGIQTTKHRRTMGTKNEDYHDSGGALKDRCNGNSMRSQILCSQYRLLLGGGLAAGVFLLVVYLCVFKGECLLFKANGS